MRKLFYIALAVLSMAMVACEGPMGPQGPEGRPGKDGLVNAKIIDLQVNSDEWSYAGLDNNNFFYGAFNVPELTDNVYDNGLYKMYREYNSGQNNKSQVELPYTNYLEYPYTLDGQTVWGFYQEHVYAEFAVGSVTIFYLASDFDYELNTEFVPEPMHFRLAIMW